MWCSSESAGSSVVQAMWTLNFRRMPCVVRSSVCSRSLARRQTDSAVCFVEQAVDIEVALQFEMSPVIERIAQGVRNGARPCQEFLFGGSRSGAEGFGHSIGTHGTPFVMITLQPDFKQVAKATVAADIGWGQMGVVIDDRLRFRILMIESFRGCGMQQKIVVNEVQNTAPNAHGPVNLENKIYRLADAGQNHNAAH